MPSRTPAQPEQIHILSEPTAHCLRALAYDFLQAIDEILLATRTGTGQESEPCLDELDFWETHASLMATLKVKGMDEIF